MSPPPRFGVRAVALSLALLAGLPLCPLWASSDIDQVLARFDEVQASIRTIYAEFTETSTNYLLRDPVVSQGRFYMTKPDAIRWEYTKPEEMRFIIASDQYTGYFPARKRAEKRNIQRWREHIFRFLGLGLTSSELKKFYDIRLVDEADLESASYLLLLEPKKKRVRKRVEEVRFWLDTETYLPRRVEYRSADGDARVVDFSTVRLNPELAASLYSVELPSDVEISDGFSGFPSLSPAATR